MSTLTLTRPARDHRLGWRTRTEVVLSDDRLLTLCVHHGDLLRGEAGTVWATIDGEWQDILLKPGHVHVMRSDTILRVSGFGDARLTIIGREAACPRPWSRPTLGALLQAAWVGMKRRREPRAVGPVPV